MSGAFFLKSLTVSTPAHTTLLCEGFREVRE